MENDPSPLRLNRHVRSESMDDTPRSRSRSEFRKQFKATAIWNDISTCFLVEGPRKRHRRQFTYIENSFTGKEAVDFLMEEIPRRFLDGRTVSRENCVALLSKFMEKNMLFRYPASDKKEFRDNNTLYTYAELPAKTPKLISDSGRLSRSNSVKERTNNHLVMNSQAAWSPHQIPSAPNNSLGWNRRQSMSHGNLSTLVSSQQDTNSITPRREFEVQKKDKDKRHDTPICVKITAVQPSPKAVVEDPKKVPEYHELEEDKENGKTANCNEESESAYEWLSFGKRKKKKAATPSRVPTRHRGSILAAHNGQSECVVDRPPSSCHYDSVTNGRSTVPANSNLKTPYAKMENGFSSMRISYQLLNEIDVRNIWKSCLLTRLRKVLCVDDTSFMMWELNGFDIQWNCEKVGSSGVVKSRNGEDFSSYLMRLMRYLEQFPFPTGSSNVITYKDNQEVNVFKTVCSYLQRECSLLTSAEASALLYVIALFHDRCKGPDVAFASTTCKSPHAEVPPGPPGVQLETEFSASTPFTRVIPRRSNGTTSTSSLLPSPLSDFSEPRPAIRTNGLLEGTQFTFSVVSDDSVSYMDALSPPTAIPTVTAKQRRRSDKLLSNDLDLNDVLRLPGLKQSPELINRLTAVCTPHDTQRLANANRQLGSQSALTSDVMYSGTSSYHSARSRLSPSIAQLPPHIVESLLSAISLILLTIPTTRRRKLHHLIRFMNKISANHCLQLDSTQENRYVVLESMCNCIVPADSPLSAVQSIHLVTLLFDHEKRVFHVDETLKGDVLLATREKQRERVTVTDEVALNDVPTPPTNVVQFCEPIQPSNYDEQKDSLEEYLLPVLDQFINDENMKPSEREKKLKQFKKSHPSVYAKRFPLDEPRKEKENQGFLRRLFSR